MWALQTMHLSNIYLYSTHIESCPGPHPGMSMYRPAGQSNLEEGKGKLTGPGSRHKSLKVRNVRVWLAEHYLELGDGAGSGWVPWYHRYITMESGTNGRGPE